MIVIIDLNTNVMIVNDWGKQTEWDLNTEDFPKWLDMSNMKVESALNGIIVYRR